MENRTRTSIEPWLTLNVGEKSVEFYKSAFNATEIYRLENPKGGFVVKLSISEAEFWISSEVANGDIEITPLAGIKVRMILITDNPDAVFANAIKAGATEIFPVGEGHGWRLGRLSDPFGLHWEIGHPLA